MAVDCEVRQRGDALQWGRRAVEASLTCKAQTHGSRLGAPRVCVVEARRVCAVEASLTCKAQTEFQERKQQGFQSPEKSTRVFTTEVYAPHRRARCRQHRTRWRNYLRRTCASTGRARSRYRSFGRCDGCPQIAAIPPSSLRRNVPPNGNCPVVVDGAVRSSLRAKTLNLQIYATIMQTGLPLETTATSRPLILRERQQMFQAAEKADRTFGVDSTPEWIGREVQQPLSAPTGVAASYTAPRISYANGSPEALPGSSVIPGASSARAQSHPGSLFPPCASRACAAT